MTLAIIVSAFLIIILFFTVTRSGKIGNGMPQPTDASGGQHKSIAISDELRDRVIALIQQGNKIEAIKLVREETNASLLTAKLIVDGLGKILQSADKSKG